jgi:hypothetical protein
VEKLIGWSDTTGGIDAAFSKDEILTWVTAYWLKQHDRHLVLVLRRCCQAR